MDEIIAFCRTEWSDWDSILADYRGDVAKAIIELLTYGHACEQALQQIRDIAEKV